MSLRATIAWAGLALPLIGGCSLLLSFDDSELKNADAGSRLPDGGGFVDSATAADAKVDGDGDIIVDTDAADCTPSEWVSLLQNGNVDDATGAPWTQSAGNGGPIVRLEESFNAHTGTKLAIFTWGDLKQQFLRQLVDVPATADSLRFSGFRCFVSQSLVKHDVVDLVIAENETVLQTFHQFTNVDGSGVCNWSEFSFTVDGNFGGKELRLGLEAVYEANPVAMASFLFDSMVLEARVCPAE